MKNLTRRIFLTCFFTLLTLGLSNAAAQACADIDAGANVYGEWDCRLTNVCGGWCYYECTCSNLFPGYSCGDVLEEAGFEVVSGPQC